MAVILDNLENIASIENFSTVEAARQLAFVCLMGDVIKKTFLACRMPTPRDGLFNHWLFRAYWALIVCFVANLLENVGPKDICISRIICSRCEAFNERLKVHVIC